MNMNKDFGECYDETIFYSTQKSSRANTPVKGKKKLITYNSDSDSSFDREFNIEDQTDNDSTVSNSHLQLKTPNDLTLTKSYTCNFTP